MPRYRALRRTLCAGALALALIGPGRTHAANAPVNQPVYGTNLLINGDAEAGAGSNTGATVAVPGWTTLIGQFTVLQYGARDASGAFPSAADPGPPNRGNNFFAGGSAASASQAVQIIDLSALAADIDTGTVSYTLQGYFGGWQQQGDDAYAALTFSDGTSTLGVSPNVGAVTPADRSNQTGLLRRSVTGVLPIGTRLVEVYLFMSRTDGTYNDGYADALALTLANGRAGAQAARIFMPLVLKGG